jgi:hypothetical protein
MENYLLRYKKLNTGLRFTHSSQSTDVCWRLSGEGIEEYILPGVTILRCNWELTVAYPGIFSAGEGVQQIQLRAEGRENGDLGAVAPWSGVPLNLQMSETGILIRLLRIYFLRISEFG